MRGRILLVCRNLELKPVGPKTSSQAFAEDEVSQALSPATPGGGAGALSGVKQLVLDAVSSPLIRVMDARAPEDFFAGWTGQGRPPFYARHGAGMAGVPRIQGARAGQRELGALRRPKTGCGGCLYRTARSGGGAGHPRDLRRAAARHKCR